MLWFQGAVFIWFPQVTQVWVMELGEHSSTWIMHKTCEWPCNPGWNATADGWELRSTQQVLGFKWERKSYKGEIHHLSLDKKVESRMAFEVLVSSLSPVGSSLHKEGQRHGSPGGSSRIFRRYKHVMETAGQRDMSSPLDVNFYLFVDWQDGWMDGYTRFQKAVSRCHGHTSIPYPTNLHLELWLTVSRRVILLK